METGHESDGKDSSSVEALPNTEGSRSKGMPSREEQTPLRKATGDGKQHLPGSPRQKECNYSAATDARLRELYVGLNVLPVTERLRDDFLTAEDREAASPSDLSLGGIVQFWAKRRGFNLARAVLDLAFQVNLLSPGEHMLLRGKIGQPMDLAGEEVRPRWDEARGELRYLGALVRQIRRGSAGNIKQILDSFEKAGWPAEIASPFYNDKQTMREAVSNLNEGLIPTCAIRFASNGHGTGVIWRLR